MPKRKGQASGLRPRLRLSPRVCTSVSIQFMLFECIVAVVPPWARAHYFHSVSSAKIIYPLPSTDKGKLWPIFYLDFLIVRFQTITLA